ncbi:MAG: DUF4276 family protein [Mariprofundales bacterium]
MRCLVCLLEEPSAKEMLKGVLPRMLPDDVKITYIIFEGKQDLEKQLERKLKGWQQANTTFLVMRDQDSGDCVAIKQALLAKVQRSGKSLVTCVRIACHELESFYLGDLPAVELGLALTGLSRKQKNHKYRQPDTLANAADELARITNQRYQKVAGSREIGRYLRIDGSNRSHSFNALLHGVSQHFQTRPPLR